MATILLTWELGGGIGHLTRLRPIGQELIKRGHTVVAALRDLTHVEQILGDTGISYFAAPLRMLDRPKPFDPSHSYAHLLANVGFLEPQTLRTTFRAWNAIFDVVRPGLVIADHSPSALLALRGRGIPCVNVGTGFITPPAAAQLPCWFPAAAAGQLQQLKQDEERVLTAATACSRLSAARHCSA